MAHDAEIRGLIERSAKAVQAQDLDAILAHHAEDMVMFDVPPPNELRGIDAYRESWAPFFRSFAESGVFEIVKLEVTAGEQVATRRRSCAAAPERNWRAIPTCACGSRSACARSRVAG